MSQARKVEILIFVNKQFVLCMRIERFLTEKSIFIKRFKELKKQSYLYFSISHHAKIILIGEIFHSALQ